MRAFTLKNGVTVTFNSVRVGAVSYTHLDVYKRQAQEGIVVGVRETEESEVADGHRDVRAASVVEGDEVEVCLLYTSRCV